MGLEYRDSKERTRWGEMVSRTSRVPSSSLLSPAPIPRLRPPPPPPLPPPAASPDASVWLSGTESTLAFGSIAALGASVPVGSSVSAVVSAAPADEALARRTREEAEEGVASAVGAREGGSAGSSWEVVLWRCGERERRGGGGGDEAPLIRTDGREEGCEWLRTGERPIIGAGEACICAGEIWLRPYPPLGWLRAGEAGIELKVEDAREGVSEGGRVGELEGNIEDDSRDGGSEPECEAGRESGGGEASYGWEPLPAAAECDREPEREGEA